MQPRLQVLALIAALLATLAGCAPPELAAPLSALPQLSPTAAAGSPPPELTPSATLIQPSSTIPPATATARPTATPTTAPSPSASAEPTATPVELSVVPTPTLPALDTTQRLALFDEVWSTIAEHYLYADFGGVDWQAIKQTYQPRALEASSSAEFYAALSEMVAELRDEHSRFENPQEAYQEQGMSTGLAYVGIGVATIEDPAGRLVTTVFPDSPASEVGLQRRDIIVAVDGQAIDGAGDAIAGPPGTQIRLSVRSPNGNLRMVTVERRAVLMEYRPEVYRFPSTNVGYVLIQTLWPKNMATETTAQLERLLADGPLDGVVIDLRGNRGGWRDQLEGLLGNFTAGKVGAFYSQSAEYALEIQPSAVYDALRAVPLVVLVDRDTKSYAEVFAAALQSQGRAQVVGINTAGNTETIYAYDLEDQSRLWVAQEGFRLPDGSNLEGRGVIPDRTISVDWRQFSEVRDPHIVKAIELIRAARPEGS